MKVLYDHQIFSMQRVGGISRYFSDLLVDHTEPTLLRSNLPIVYSENTYLKESYQFELKKLTNRLPFRLNRQFYYHRNNILSKKIIKEKDFDLFHPTYYDTYFLGLLENPFVLTVHDMTHELFPDKFLFYDNTSKKKRILAEKAAHIIAVSENTKKDLIHIFNVNPDKISVVYHGINQLPDPSEQLFENYLLFVGERDGYKNFGLFLEAILPLLRENPTLKVVCTNKPFNKKEQQLFEDWKIASQMNYIRANESELASLYKYAKALVYPSLYEGFGLPILEAFSNGCPVCLSNTSCFPEIAGDAACYFDPTSKKSIKTIISQLYYDEHLRMIMKERGRIQVEKFSIGSMIKNTFDVYAKTIDNYTV
jgi:glycosyltransferase involved in cell wall biosynthesis